LRHNSGYAPRDESLNASKQVLALGPPTKEWLCKSLAGLSRLTELTITAERAKEEDLLKVRRVNAWGSCHAYARPHPIRAVPALK